MDTSLRVIGVLLLLWLTMVANEWFPVFRLESPARNAIWALGSYTLPWLALGVTLWRLQRWRRAAALLMLVVPLAYTLVMAPIVAMHLMSIQSDRGKDRSFQRVAAIAVDGGRVAVYRSDCGLPCGNETIAVRHERRLVAGLLLVRRMDGFASAHDPRHDVIGPRRVRLSVDGPGPARSRVYELKPWVYF